MKIKRIVQVFGTFLVLSMASSAPHGQAQAGQPDKSLQQQGVADRFEALLKSIDVVPPSRAAFQKAFPDAKARLIAAASDTERDTWTRIRAISLLSFFPEPDVRSALLAVTGDVSVAARREALYTVGRSFGSPGDLALVRVLETATSDAESEVRDYALRALRWVDHPEADVVLSRLADDNSRPILRKLARHVQQRRGQRMTQKVPR